MYIRAGNKYKSRGGRLPLAVVSILPFVGHALGGQLAERKYKQAGRSKKRGERFHCVASLSSIISFFNRPDHRSPFITIRCAISPLFSALLH